MVKIRLSRRGSKNDPFYKIVVMDERGKREGKTLDSIGYYYPFKKDVVIDKTKIKHWQNKGAVLTKAVIDLLEKPVKKS